MPKTYPGGFVTRSPTAPTANAASGMWTPELMAFNKLKGNWPAVASEAILPTISGLVGWYDVSSVSGTTWTDKSGSGNHATIEGASVVSTSENGATRITNALNGSSTAHRVLWPATILPATYTLFHVTRYTGGTNRRIVQGYVGNWLSGHWDGKAGQAFHNGWVTDSTSNYYSNNWFISTDQNSLFRTNGITRGTSGGGTSDRLHINSTGTTYGTTESSTWMMVEMIVYNRTLNSSEYGQVESYLASRWGITLNT